MNKDEYMKDEINCKHCTRTREGGRKKAKRRKEKGKPEVKKWRRGGREQEKRETDRREAKLRLCGLWFDPWQPVS